MNTSSSIKLFIVCLFLVVTYLNAKTIEWNTTLTLDSLFIVDSGDILIVKPGVTVNFVNGGYIQVDGTLRVEGTLESTVTFKQLNTTSMKLIHLYTGATVASFKYVSMEQVAIDSTAVAITRASGNVTFDNVVISGGTAINGYNLVSLDITSSRFENIDVGVKLMNDGNLYLRDSTIIGIDKTSVPITVTGTLNMQGNTISGTVKIDCVEGSIIGNTINANTNGIEATSKTNCGYKPLVIRDNTIESENSHIYVSYRVSNDVTISGNTLTITGNSNTTSSITVETYSQSNPPTSTVLIQNNKITGGNIYYRSRSAKDTLSIEGNTIEKLGSVAITVISTGVMSIKSNIFKHFDKALDLDATSLIVTDNTFENGNKVITVTPLLEGVATVDFNRNTVTNCRQIVESIIVGTHMLTRFTINGNTFDSNGPISDFPYLLGFHDYSGRTIDISNNEFKNSKGVAISIINEDARWDSYVSIKNNKFTGSAYNSFYFKKQYSNNITVVLEQNIFKNSEASKEFFIYGVNQEYQIQARYNYWGSNQWTAVKARVDEKPEIVNQVPFFLTEDISNYAKTNLGYGDPVQRLSKQKIIIICLVVAIIGLIIVVIASILVASVVKKPETKQANNYRAMDDNDLSTKFVQAE
jgi:hypothetical protein